MKIVSLVPVLLLGAVLLGGRSWGEAPHPRDVGQLPDAPAQQGQDGNGELDAEDAFVLVSFAPPAISDLPHARAARPTGDVPSGRLFVSEIFRPPILSRA